MYTTVRLTSVKSYTLHGVSADSPHETHSKSTVHVDFKSTRSTSLPPIYTRSTSTTHMELKHTIHVHLHLPSDLEQAPAPQDHVTDWVCRTPTATAHPCIISMAHQMLNSIQQHVTHASRCWSRRSQIQLPRYEHLSQIVIASTSPRLCLSSCLYRLSSRLYRLSSRLYRSSTLR